MRRWLTDRRLWGALGALAVLAQLVPYRAFNPSGGTGPTWDSPQTQELARRACFDCHSHEVAVPIYGYVAPFAWLVRFHVDEAREHFNMSRMDVEQHDAHEAAEMVEEGEMPPGYYKLLHPEARLDEAETAALIRGLAATFGTDDDEDEHH